MKSGDHGLDSASCGSAFSARNYPVAFLYQQADSSSKVKPNNLACYTYAHARLAGHLDVDSPGT